MPGTNAHKTPPVLPGCMKVLPGSALTPLLRDKPRRITGRLGPDPACRAARPARRTRRRLQPRRSAGRSPAPAAARLRPRRCGLRPGRTGPGRPARAPLPGGCRAGGPGPGPAGDMTGPGRGHRGSCPASRTRSEPDFSVRAADLTGDVQCLLQVPGRARIPPVTRRTAPRRVSASARPSRSPASRKMPRLLQVPGRPWQIAGEPPHDSEVDEGGGPLAPFAPFTADVRCLLQVPGRARIVPGQPPCLPQVIRAVSSPRRLPRSREMPSASCRSRAAPG